MEEYFCGDFWTYLQDVGPRVFRYWVYRRMFTPDEQSKKYIDQEFFEDSYCKMGIIKECIQLPDNDLLIGFMDMDEEGVIGEDGNRSISYYKLSEIRMEYCERDQLTGLED